MKRTLTFLLMALISAGVFAESQTGVIMKATTAPVIDGVMEEAWDVANVYDIDKPYRTETPTIGAAGETTWRALWNNDGIFVLLTVNDNVWYPSYKVPGSNNWEYDKPEIYFDVNYVLEDGSGASAGAASGHHQIAPGAAEANIDGTPTTETNGVIWAFKVDDPAYVAEYFVPWTVLTDKDGIAFDKTATMGFDVTIIDRDGAEDTRQRAVWSNIGTFDESWSNMNEAGHVTLDGADAPVYIDKITLTGGVITTDNGTLEIGVEIEPADASNKNLKWTVENKTGRATVNNKGVVTGILDGVVTITADATDGSYEQASVDVIIVGQIPTVWELNVIRNPLFDDVTEAGAPAQWGGWIDGAAYGPGHKVVEGVATLEVLQAHATEGWHYQFNQNGLTALPDVPYTFSFVAWSSVDRIGTVDFEDISGNNYNRYGASTTGKGGRSEWDIDLTTEPQKFEFDVTFDQIVANTDQKVQFMLSQAASTVYIDSVMLINAADLALVSTDTVVVFTVDMTAAITAGTFDPAADKLYITGSMFEWAAPGTRVDDQTMARVEETGYYTKTLTLPAGEYQYKYFINDGWDGGEWAGDPNRVVTVTASTSVSDIFGPNTNVPGVEKATVNVYPNPATSSFTVASGSQISSVIVSDLTGKIVYSSPVNHTQVSINNQFENGIYIVRVFTDEGVTVKKLQVIR